MAYSGGSQQLVLFGGRNGSTDLGDTWTFNGAWTNLSPTTHPSARSGAAFAFDLNTNQMVLFGGDNNQNDTWVWVGGRGNTWIKLSPATSPPPRSNAAMAYDPISQQLVLFGGESGTTSLNDTWTWNGSNWTQQSPATSPPGGIGISMSGDVASKQLVLFGGATSGGVSNGTWTWTGSDWTQLSPATSPPERTGAAMAYDTHTTQLVLFGGENVAGTTYMNDTWTWGGANWTRRSTAASPSARQGASMSYSLNAGLVVFGGSDGSSAFHDTWGYSTTTPAPTVSAVIPKSGPLSGGTILTITGTGFVPGASVVIGQGNGAGTGAIPATNVTVVSWTKITAVTGGGAKAGNWGVFVTSAGGTSGASSGATFTYNLAPIVSAVSPTSGPTTGGTAITISGSGFVSGATVVIGQGNGAGTGAIPATNVVVVSPTEITAVTGGGAKAGTWSVFVTTTAGTSAGTSGANFSYQ
jgi:hypothetical protein